MPTNQQLSENNAPDASCCPIVDLRQYTLYPGTRDDFITLFDREFVETQEAAGMRIIGQFRDLGDPNRFVWLRGFADMPSREEALTSFYIHGDAWRQHAEAARSAMIDTTDALLLRPAHTGSGFSLPSAERRPALGTAAPESVIVAAIHSLSAPASADFLDLFSRDVEPVLKNAGAEILASFVTEHSPNNFPRLELREGENVFVQFLGFRNLAAHHAYMTELGRNPRWRNDVYPALLRHIHGRPQLLRLSPTSRSQLRC